MYYRAVSDFIKLQSEFERSSKLSDKTAWLKKPNHNNSIPLEGMK